MPRVLIAGSTYGGHHYSHGSVPPVGNGNDNRNGLPQMPRMPRTTFAGAEPGISPASVSYGHIQEKCVIEVADYSIDNFTLRRFANDEFVQLMAEPMPVHDLPRTSSLDSKRSCVRWINIGGLDWDVISAVGLKYNLHALALEDILHEQGHNHSKADYYNEHLFVRILCHSLEHDGDEDNDNDPNAVRPSLPSVKSEFPGHLESDLERAQFSAKDVDERSKTPITMNEHSREFKSHFTALSGFLAPARQRRLVKIRSLTKGDRVNVRHQPLFIFLLRNGTVITMFPSPSLEFTAPIAERLQYPESVLRTSEDASLLVESFLDLVVDRVLEIMDEYQDKIHRLEHNVLLQPSMSTMRSLHILSGDLIMHKRTLEPIKTMIFGLRRYDLYRCAALADNAEAERERLGIPEENNGHEKKKKKKRKVEGYLSYKTVMYLADVYDHIEFVLTSLDMFAGISENLINYAFNTASYEMNQVMRRLTLATIIFLPLTLLTGYFGMNFVHFAAINNSDLLFWKISIPVMLALIPIFMMTDIQHIIQSLRKRWEARRSVKAYRRKS